MIISVNNKETIDENSFVSDYKNFIIELDDGHKFLYKQVVFDVYSNNFTYMRIHERLGETIFDFCLIDKDKDKFKDMTVVQYKEADTYDIYKVSKIKFPNLDVIYSY